MKPVDQTVFGLPHGNCFAACIASILELTIEQVPNFVREGDGWWDAAKNWCQPRGYALLWVKHDAVACGYVDPNPLIEAGHFIITSGLSPRGDFLHCVIEHRGKIVHDPHPSRDGIRGAWVDFMVLVPNTLAA